MVSKGKWFRWFGVLGAVALLVWLAVYFFHQRNNEKKYQTVIVTRRDVRQAVTATGQLNPLVNVQVGCQISGTLLKFFADFNSPVKAGQVIAQLDPALYNAALKQAEGNLANAKAQLRLAELNANRKRELREKDMLAQADYDAAVAQLQQAQAAVQTSEAARDKAQVDLDHCTISSPIDGIVISRNIDVGQTVAASLNAPTLFVIANDLTKMQIDSNVAEADVGGVEPGQDVEFTVDAYPGRIFQGKVVQVRNAAITVQNVVTYDCVIEVNNEELKLKPGMTASVSIILGERKNALTLTNAAMRFSPPGASASPAQNEKPSGSRPGRRAQKDPTAPRTVYRLRDPSPATKDGGETGALEAVDIKAGISDGVFTEVISGLSEGDHVATALLGAQQQPAAPASNPFGGRPPFR